jgi:hypothetical protein
MLSHGADFRGTAYRQDDFGICARRKRATDWVALNQPILAFRLFARGSVSHLYILLGPAAALALGATQPTRHPP